MAHTPLRFSSRIRFGAALLSAFGDPAAAPAVRSGAELVVDSPGQPGIQRILDELNFDPAGKEGNYRVVKKRCAPIPQTTDK